MNCGPAEQWKAELEERFGLVFEILDRAIWQSLKNIDQIEKLRQRVGKQSRAPAGLD